MNPTIAQMLVQSRHDDFAREAAGRHLASAAKGAIRSSSAGAATGTRRLVAGLAFHILAVVR
jgi:hypothetical protein